MSFVVVNNTLIGSKLLDVDLWVNTDLWSALFHNRQIINLGRGSNDYGLEAIGITLLSRESSWLLLGGRDL